MENSELQIAEQLALQTNRHFFLTGKAGTGKTTLLKSIAEKTYKNFVIVAPTGVAAINAGGVTIHSMFNLPLTSFIPTGDYVDMNLATNRKLLQSHLKFRREKLQVLREMEMLIIDEVSMVRADILDAVDFVLRVTRKNQEPFGGVQVMLIGDMHQLPPVVKNDEWEILKKYYSSPYFFDAHVWKDLDAFEVELKTIYRQKDERFLNILNNIRHQRLEREDYEELKKRYNPDFKPDGEGYVLLTTHNRKADYVNETELRKLPAKLHKFEAEIEGDFPEHLYPCERILQLKEGAQVMFIRNDAESGAYYNGKLAKVKKIEGASIQVTFNDNKQDYWLHRETWENISFSMEQGTEKIHKKQLGSFSQFPLRLAWAITIHKSQGLTFDKVIIDAGQSFAAGQVYVALSRCRTLEGIVLHSLIHRNVLFNDERITAFSGLHHDSAELETILPDAKKEYANFLLKRLFSFEKLRDKIADWKEVAQEKDLPNQEKVLKNIDELAARAESIMDVSRKFQQQLDRLLLSSASDSEKINTLKDRASKAIEFFTENIFTQIITPVHAHIQLLAYKTRVKKYLREVQQMQDSFWNKIHQLYHSVFLDEKLYSGEVKYTKNSLEKIVTSATSAKKVKGDTYNDTLTLYRQGKTIDEIATIRSLAPSTIKTHFARWILSGEIDVNEVLPSEKVERIEKFLQGNPTPDYSVMKNAFGDDFDYGEVRMVVNHVSRKRSVQSQN